MNRLTDARLRHSSHEFSAEVDGVKLVIEDNGGDGSVDMVYEPALEKVGERTVFKKNDLTEKYRKAAQDLVTRFQETIKGEAEEAGKNLSQDGVSVTGRDPFSLRLSFPHSSCKQLALPPPPKKEDKTPQKDPFGIGGAFGRGGILYTLNGLPALSFSPSGVTTSAEDCDNDGYADSAKFITSDGIKVFLGDSLGDMIFVGRHNIIPGSDTTIRSDLFSIPSHFFRDPLLEPFDSLFFPEAKIEEEELPFRVTLPSEFWQTIIRESAKKDAPPSNSP